MRMKFLGATRQVTGSCFLLEAGGLKLLIDCGMYQERDYQDRNWEECPVPPEEIDFLLLTHAHLDHVGLIPKWVRDGFTGPILATSASVDLAKIVLADSAKIQEEDAEYKAKRHKKENRKGRHPEIPLYTVEDAERTFPQFRQIPYREVYPLNDQVSVCFRDAGHILGSAMLELLVKEEGRERTFIFSGDIGQWDKPIVRDPTLFDRADYVIMESTYGDRDHENDGDIEDRLAEVINDTLSRGGNLVIPTFAIERAQELMFHIGRLVHQKKIPHLLSFLDSPMAVDVTEVFRQHRDCMDEETKGLYESGTPPFRYPGLTLVRNTEQSKAINRIKGSCIIMAGSGMCTGGRIKHHLVHNITNPNSTILFVGYQAKNTLGRYILEKPDKVRIHGAYHPLRSRIEQIHGFSAHADRSALIRWVTHLESPPRCVFLVHGEEESAEALGQALKDQKGWEVLIPEYIQEWIAD